MDNLSIRQLNYLTERYELDKQLQADKEITLAVVRRNPALYLVASEELKKDVDVALACVKSDGRALRFLSDELRENETVVLSAVENFCASFSFAHGKAKKSVLVAEAVAKRGGETIELLDESFLDDENIAKIAVARNPKALKYFSSRVRSLESVVLQAANRDRTALIYAADDAFKSKAIFEKVISPVGGRFRIVSLTNNTPQGVFDEIERRGLTFSYSAQNLDFLALDRDKLLVCLKCGEGNMLKKADLLRKYVLLEDVEMVSLIIEKYNLPHNVILAEVKFASENRKVRVLPLLLKATRGVGAKDVDDKNARLYLIRSLRRKSPTAMARFKENYAQYLDDEEVMMLAAQADGTILKVVQNTSYINKKEFVTACLESYIVKLSDGAILDGLNIDLTYEQAVIACRRDGRNYFYLSDEFKKMKEIAVNAVRSDESVYDRLSEELKNDADVIREKRLWIR